MFLPRTISITHYDRAQISALHGEPFVSLLLTFADTHLNKLIGNTCKLQRRGGAVMESFWGLGWGGGEQKASNCQSKSPGGKSDLQS